MIGSGDAMRMRLVMVEGHDEEIYLCVIDRAYSEVCCKGSGNPS